MRPAGSGTDNDSGAHSSAHSEGRTSSAGVIGLTVSLALLIGFGGAAWTLRNSPAFSLMRLGLALEDRDPVRAAPFLQLPDAAAFVADGVVVEIGPWRPLPGQTGVVEVQTHRSHGRLSLRGRCGPTTTTAQLELERVRAGTVDLTLLRLPVYDWRIVAVTPSSTCRVQRACGASGGQMGGLDELEVDERADPCGPLALR